MSVLITGAGGQVGRELAALCGPDDRALDRQALDITQPESIASVLDAHRPAVVINAAAYTAVDRAEAAPEQAQALNADAPATLAQACAARGIVLLHLSTDYVFDGRATHPYTESDVAAPLGVYGASKWAGEQGVRRHCPQHLILRVSWVFGRFGNNFVKTMLRLGAERPALRVVADQIGGPTAAADIAKALMQLARRVEAGQSVPWGTWHFAGQPFVSWYHFAGAIFEEAVAQGLLDTAPVLTAITTADYPTPARRPAQSSLSMVATTASLGIKPPDWRAALQHVVAQLKAT